MSGVLDMPIVFQVFVELGVKLSFSGASHWSVTKSQMKPLHTITPNYFRIRFHNFIPSVFESLTRPVTTSSAMPVTSLKYILFHIHSLALKCNHYYYIHIKASCLHNVAALCTFVSRVMGMVKSQNISLIT
jgi:hypothetical protein